MDILGLAAVLLLQYNCLEAPLNLCFFLSFETAGEQKTDVSAFHAFFSVLKKKKKKKDEVDSCMCVPTFFFSVVRSD